MASECDSLTALCRRSKAWHGYDAEFMAACEAELAVTPERLGRGGHAVALDRNDLPVGFMQVLATPAECWLEALFVEPHAMGQGVGKALFARARQAAQALGAHALVIASDPGAEDFYLAMGAVRAGTQASGSIAGRALPRLVLPLGA